MTLLVMNAGRFQLDRVTPSLEMIFGLVPWALAALLLAWVLPDAWRTRRCRQAREAR